METVRLVACFFLASVYFQCFDAVPLAETSTVGKLTTTLKTTAAATGKPDKTQDDGLAVRFGMFDMNDGDITFPGIGTRGFGLSNPSPDTSLSSSLASSMSGNLNSGAYPSNLPSYEFQHPGQDTQPCVCCGSNSPCGGWPTNVGTHVPQGNIPQVPFNPQYPDFQVDPIPGYNDGSFSGSKASSSSFSNQNVGGNLFGNQGYPNGMFHHPSVYPSGSGSSASSTSFSGGFGYPGLPNQGGFPGMFGHPFPPSGYPVLTPTGGYGGSSSSASSSSSSFNGGSGSSSWSSSESSSGTKGGPRPVRPLRPKPPPQVTPELTLPDGNCRSTGC